MGDKMSWDEYREAHGLTNAEAGGEAFAAYLHYLSDGKWNGEVHRVDVLDELDPREGR